jgi:hypothetical protein
MSSACAAKFTQHSSWQQVNAFSQPLVVKATDELVVSTPMRPPTSAVAAKSLQAEAMGQRLATGL